MASFGHLLTPEAMEEAAQWEREQQDKRRDPEIDAVALKELANSRADEIFEELLGSASQRARGGDARWGGKGSFQATLSGPNAGGWHDFEAGQGGDILDFWAVHALGLTRAQDDFPRTIKSLRERLGHGGGLSDAERERLEGQARKREALIAKEAQREAEAKARVTAAVRAVCGRIKDTPGEAYLRKRGLTKKPPISAVQFHDANKLAPQERLSDPYHQALTVFATNEAGVITGGQRIPLDADGNKAPDATNSKPMFGSLSDGVCMRLPAEKGCGSALHVVESPEGAMTLWEATGAEVWAVLGVGRFSAVLERAPLNRRVVLCPDQDAAGSDATISFAKARDALALRHADLWEARDPSELGTKRDLNDLLMDAGIGAVREALANARRVSLISGPQDPKHEAPPADRDAQIAATRKAIWDWGRGSMADLRSGKRTTPRKALLTGAMGVGKSRAVYGGRGEPGVLHEAHGLVSLMALPDHGKCEEAFQIYQKNAPSGGPPAIHLKGRSQPDPANEAQSMCLIPKAANSVGESGQSVRNSLCAGCAFAESCAYLQQEVEIGRRVSEGRGLVVFGVHETLSQRIQYETKDDEGEIIRKELKPQLVVLDERLRNGGVQRYELALSDITKAPEPGPHSDEERADLMSDFAEHAAPLTYAIQLAAQMEHAAAEQAKGTRRPYEVYQDASAGAVGFLSLLRGWGWTEEHCAAASGAVRALTANAGFGAARRAGEWAQTGHDQEAAQQFTTEVDALDLKHAERLMALFDAICLDLATGQDRGVGAWLSADGQHMNVSKLQAFSHTGGHFLYMDGSGNRPMAEALFGALQHHHHPVSRRNLHVTQITGHEFAESGVTGKGRSGVWAERAEKTREHISGSFDREGADAIFAQRSVLRSLGFKEGNGVCGNFGGLRGRDSWEDCVTAFIVGRLQPKPDELEAFARAYAAADGARFNALPPGTDYLKRNEWLRMRHGPAHPMVVKYHPDPWCQRYLESVREEEISQALDRLRLIYNTVPKRVFLLNSVVTNVTVDAVVPWSQFGSDGMRVEMALRGHGVLPLSKREAARMLPNIWQSPSEAQRDLEGLQFSTVEWAQPEAERIGPDCKYYYYLQIGPIRIDLQTLKNTPQHFDNAHAFLVEYACMPEKPGGRARKHRAVVMAADEAGAYEKLYFLAGILRTFDVLGVLV